MRDGLRNDIAKPNHRRYKRHTLVFFLYVQTSSSFYQKRRGVFPLPKHISTSTKTAKWRKSSIRLAVDDFMLYTLEFYSTSAAIVAAGRRTQLCLGRKALRLTRLETLSRAPKWIDIRWTVQYVKSSTTKQKKIAWHDMRMYLSSFDLYLG